MGWQPGQGAPRGEHGRPPRLRAPSLARAHARSNEGTDTWHTHRWFSLFLTLLTSIPPKINKYFLRVVWQFRVQNWWISEIPVPRAPVLREEAKDAVHPPAWLLATCRGRWRRARAERKHAHRPGGGAGRAGGGAGNFLVENDITRSGILSEHNLENTGKEQDSREENVNSSQTSEELNSNW